MPGPGVTTIDGGGSGSVVYASGVGSTTKLDGFTITNGNSHSYGGGMYNTSNSSPVVTNCTFYNNSATSGFGGGMCNFTYSSPVVTNCILWGDSPQEIYDISSTPVVTYCDVQGGYTGTGNINADPLFVDAGAGDYHLQAGSPCIDVGSNAAPSLPSTDFEGDPRIVNGVVDMGVDEYVPPPPQAMSSDPTGVTKDEFYPTESVYATGSGFPANTDIWVYVVGDRVWTDGMAIPADLSNDGRNTVPTDANGDLAPVIIWPAPLTPGEYDVVFDVYQNAEYNALFDCVDHPNHPGFIVQQPEPKAEAEVFEPFKPVPPPEAPEVARTEVSALYIRPAQVLSNQEVRIYVDIYKSGDKAGRHNVMLNVDGEVVGGQAVDVPANSYQRVVLTTYSATPGNHKITIDGHEGWFTVLRNPEYGFPGSGGLGTVGLLAIIIASVGVGLGIFFALRRREA